MREGDKVNLKKWPTAVKPVYKSKDQYLQTSGRSRCATERATAALYASNRYAVLMIFPQQCRSRLADVPVAGAWLPIIRRSRHLHDRARFLESGHQHPPLGESSNRPS